eukprot:2472650-Prymnesium_polylepis.1
MPRSSVERRLEWDGALALVIVTPDSLCAQTAAAQLLRAQLAKRGVSGVVVDEAHAVLSVSQANFRPEVARTGVGIALLREAVEASGAPRPWLLALTATLPPQYEAEAVRRLRLRDGHEVVRGEVDRPGIAIARSVMAELSPAESAAQYAVRTYRRIKAGAPPAALAGRKILYVTKATQAPVIALALEAAGFPAAAYATNGMSDEQRAASLVRWKGDAGVTLIASPAFGQGINESSVTLVGHIGLPETPLDYAQQIGRIRRDGFAVIFLRPRYLIERLGLSGDGRPGEEQLNARLEGVLQLLDVLYQPDCVRRALVEWLGGTLEACAGCDECVCRVSSCPSGCCGAFAYDRSAVRGAAAARHVLASADPEWTLLSSYLAAVPPGASGAFSSPHAHAQLVMTL